MTLGEISPELQAKLDDSRAKPRKRLSITQLAKEACVSRPTTRKWLSGRDVELPCAIALNLALARLGYSIGHVYAVGVCDGIYDDREETEK